MRNPAAIRTIPLALVLVLAVAGSPGGSQTRDFSEQLAALTSAGSPGAYQEIAAHVAAAPDSEQRAQLAFALALADFRAGRYSEAEPWFAIARRGSMLSDYAALYSARNAHAGYRFTDVVARVDSVSWEGSSLRTPARRLKADALTASGAAPAAMAFLASQPDLQHEPALLAALAAAQQAEGRLPESAVTLQDIYFKFPLSPEAEPAWAALAQLRKSEGSSVPEFTPAQWRQRADLLWNQEAYIGARAAYDRLAELASGAEKDLSRLRSAIARYRQGDRDGACRSIRSPDETPGAERFELWELLARCDMRARRWERAEGTLARLAAEPEAAGALNRALLAAANTALLHRDGSRAIAFFHRLLQEFPDGPDSTATEWRLAWTLYSEGKVEEASTWMDRHLVRADRSPFFSRALYWRARIAASAGDSALARELLGRLVKLAPRDLTAKYARAELGSLPGPSAGDSSALPAWVGELAGDGTSAAPPALGGDLQALVRRTEALARVGLAADGERELDAVLQNGAHPDLWMARARLAKGQRGYLRASEYARRAYPGYLNAELKALSREAWELLFPLEHWETIRRESEQQELDPYLVAGLIRQESRFDPQAVSSAGALGLMQLMPATARGLAGDRTLSTEHILDPDTNIRLGTRHLAGLMRRFDGSAERAVAAYNGGGTRVADWMKQLPADTPRFVESIPLTQTREFVYIVLRNHDFYKDLYSD